MCYEALLRRGERLNNNILSRYIGGQIVVNRKVPGTKGTHRVVGKIESISLAGIVIEASCDWVARKKPLEKLWRKDNSTENFVEVEIKKGWTTISDGRIKIPTLYGCAVLIPKGSTLLIETGVDEIN
ncbi:MAG TPA: hypothetical protein PJ997_00950 [Candidatus Paceibacterota bacterium]|nr:hypothetical protein [Candidatus Paceibacterota bacterium]HMP18890.1 hypothetical protein [Candidatus Paceibacterota bacterium]HMP85051.1 hypothetical protein [Candidatus Paceibacterota bacterium]